MKEVLFLRVEFTPEEIKNFSSDLARKTAELSQAEEDKKAAVAQFADQLASAKATVSRLARNINSGYEMRNVDCEVTLHSPKKGLARIIRLDTGEEVNVRPMTADELQEKLPLK